MAPVLISGEGMTVISKFRAARFSFFFRHGGRVYRSKIHPSVAAAAVFFHLASLMEGQSFRSAMGGRSW